jgi:integrase family protein with SAM-like domain
MAAFTLNRSSTDPSIFAVVGPDGQAVTMINEFLQSLALRGRSAYTVRSYAHGLAHFFDWLHTAGQSVDDVTPHTIEAYLTMLSTTPKGAPVPPIRARPARCTRSPARPRPPSSGNPERSIIA